MIKVIYKSVLIGFMLIPCMVLAKGESELGPAVASIYDHIIMPNVQSSVQSCQAMSLALSRLPEQAKTEAIRPAFKDLIMAWKRVQASYVAGEVNDDLLDTPAAIDIFHQGKEDIHEQLARALASDAAPEKALYKYSHRTLTALESILFTDEDISLREQQFAQVIVHSVCQRLMEIEQGYRQGRDEFLKDAEHALAYYAHSMATSIFAAKDWRIGDPAGLTRKYQDKPDYGRSEYALSGLNREALQAIFTTQEQMFTEQDYANMHTIMLVYQAETLSQEIKTNLKQMQKLLGELETDRSLVERLSVEPIYQLSNELYKQYYISLISALPVVAKVLDADGD